MEEILVCPQRIYRFSFSDADQLEKIKNASLKEEYYKPGTQCKSKDFSIHKREEYLPLFEWIQKCINQVKQVEMYDCDYLKVTQSWINKSSYGEHLIPHWHPNSILSGIFYLSDHVVETDFALRDNWYVGHPDSSGQSYIRLSTCQERQMIFHKVESISGNLILFPAAFRHGVEVNYSEEDRYTISFNTFPSGNIGIYSDLAAMEVNVV
tara:strand:+ start:413 stop:1039 length:627 start_codon:yes stop_codon:yes gene_type:complete